MTTMNYQQELIPGTDVPILAGVDPGVNGCIVKNRPDGSLELFKTPEDMKEYHQILSGCDLVVIEKQSSGGFHGKTRTSDNSVFAQYKELEGFMKAIDCPFHPIRPQEWLKFLGLPKKSKIPDTMWKDFLHSFSCQIFPGRKISKYAADAHLLYHVARLLWPMSRDKWP